MEFDTFTTREKNIMSKPKVDFSIYLLTDENCLQGRNLLACVAEALESGVTLVQYRAKNKESNLLYREAYALKKLCDEYNKLLIINDRLDIAMAVKAAGVHLGQNDLSCSVAREILGNDYIIGVSAHNIKEALQAEQDGADYLGCGAVFYTNSKSDVKKIGLNKLCEIHNAVSIPVVGIGGINVTNYGQVLKTGANGAAMISGILAASDIKAEVRKLIKIKESIVQI